MKQESKVGLSSGWVSWWGLGGFPNKTHWGFWGMCSALIAVVNLSNTNCLLTKYARHVCVCMLFGVVHWSVNTRRIYGHCRLCQGELANLCLLWNLLRCFSVRKIQLIIYWLGVCANSGAKKVWKLNRCFVSTIVGVKVSLFCVLFCCWTSLRLRLILHVNIAHFVLSAETRSRRSRDQREGSWLADIATAILGNSHSHSALRQVWGEYKADSLSFWPVHGVCWLLLFWHWICDFKRMVLAQLRVSILPWTHHASPPSTV